MITGGQKIQRDVVRLRRARREVDFVRLHVEKTRDGDARIFDSVCRPATVLMRERSRVSKIGGKERQHYIDNSRVTRCRRMMIEINWKIRGHPTMINTMRIALLLFALALLGCGTGGGT